MSLHAVVWRYTDDTTLIEQARAAHGAYLKELFAKGVLREAGPLQDGTGGLLVFDVADQTELQPLLDNDPYTTQGVIVDTQILPWKVVLGSLAA